MVMVMVEGIFWLYNCVNVFLNGVWKVEILCNVQQWTFGKRLTLTLFTMNDIFGEKKLFIEKKSLVQTD